MSLDDSNLNVLICIVAEKVFDMITQYFSK